MKKLLFLLLILTVFFSSQSFAQGKLNDKPGNLPMLDNKSVYWGFSFGLTKTGFNIYKNSTFFNSDSVNYLAIEGKTSPGIFLGPIFNFKLSKHLDLRFLCIISFPKRTLNYYFGASTDSNNITNTSIQIQSSYFELPILLKYKGNRINNFRPYVIAGVSPKYDFATLKKVNYDSPHIIVAPFDVYLEVGTGFDFYFPYFKFSIELKYSNGFFNLLEQENTIYSAPIDALKSNSFILSFHFEG